MSARNTDSIGSTIKKVKSDSNLANSIGSKKHSSRNPGHGTGAYPETSGNGDQGGYPTQFPLKPPVVHYGTVDGVLPIDIDMTKFYSTGAKMVISGNVTINFLNPPAPGKSQTVTIVVKQDVVGGHSITWGSTVIGNPQPDVTAGVETVFELTTFDQGFTFHRSGTGTGVSGGTSFPLRYPLSAHGTIGLVTEVFDWNFHGHKATLSGDISVAFSNTPLINFGEDIKLHFFHDGLAGNRIITFPGTVKNLTTVTISAGQEAIIVLTTDDAGVSFDAYLQGGTSTSGVSNLSQLNIDVDKDWAGHTQTNHGGVFFNQTDQAVLPSALGVVYKTTTQKSHSFFAGITEIARFEETTPGNYINQFLALLNMNGKEIKGTKHIEFNGFESLIKTTTPGIGMDNVIDNAMIYNVPLTTQTHNFKAAGELLAAISRVGTNSGLLTIDNVVSKLLQTDQLFLSSASTPAPLLNGAIWRDSGSGLMKARQNGITEDLIGSTEFLNDLTDVTLASLLDNQILQFNSLTSKWENVNPPAADNLGSHIATQILKMAGFGIENVSSFTSSAVNPATSGAIRLGNSENLFWRDAGNTSNVGLTVNSLDEIVYNSHLMPSVGGSLKFGKSSKRVGTIFATSLDLDGILEVAGNVILNGDTFLGNAIGDELSVTAKIVSDLKMDNGFVIEPTVGSKTGYYVERTGSIGTRGALGTPFETGFETTAAGADTSFGNALGSMGVYGRNDTSPALLVIKVLTSPSKWKGVLLNDITLT